MTYCNESVGKLITIGHYGSVHNVRTATNSTATIS